MGIANLCLEGDVGEEAGWGVWAGFVPTVKEKQGWSL